MSPLLLLAKSIKQRPNVLLICVDDLRPELKCFGVDYIHSPNIDALAARGRAFHRHYVQAPTCGASRYTLLTGR
ncbi:MAG: sulfatase-like hydrolase/transferase, partial [Limisphaerales bacterium]